MKRTMWFALSGIGAAIAIASFGCSASDSGAGASDDGGTSPSANENENERPGDTTSEDGGGGGSTDPNTPSGNRTFALKAVKLQQVGRNGDSLRIALKGTDSSKQTTSMFVRFRDKTDNPVIAIDSDWDGIADTDGRRFRFDTSTLGTPDFTGAVVQAGLYPIGSRIARAVIVLEDESGKQSPEMIADIANQAIRGEGEACDTTLVADRCADGMSCASEGGAPATCHAGVAPTLSQLAYVRGASPRMLFRGTEPDQDVARIDVEFLDAAGNAKIVNLSGDPENPDLRDRFSIALDPRADNLGTIFFRENIASSGFDGVVPKVAATVTDAAGHVSARVVSSVGAVPTRTNGQACDDRGFDACASGSVCSPGLPDVANKCASVGPLRTTKCSSAGALDPAKGMTKAFGLTSGASLWDPPAGCVSNDATGRPESVVPLHLAKAASSLKITTAMPETEIDTALYLLPSCAAQGTAALACNDDDRGYTSTLSLENVPAGDYVVVVESISMRGGKFGVSIEAK
ncbi:hypothetical protein [Labilithrix luteola]|nr:hypothetical protein [Labilithrix luteola]